MKKIKVIAEAANFPKILNKAEWKEEGSVLTQIIMENDNRYSYYKMLFGSVGVPYSYEDINENVVAAPKAKKVKKQEKEVAKVEVKPVKREGIVASYTHHNGRIGVLIKVYTDTDFAARTDELKEFGKNIAMQVAVMGDENLLEQEFIKDPTSVGLAAPSVKIQEVLDKIRKDLGEKVEIGSTIKFEL